MHFMRQTVYGARESKEKEMKRNIVLLLLICALLSVTGCSFMTGYEIARAMTEDDSEEKMSKEVMTVDGYDIQVAMGDGWERRADEDTPFDLQCEYKGDEAYASFFYFYYVDLTDGTTAEDIFDLQNRDIMDKRDKVKIIEDVSERVCGDKQIRSMMYSAENEGCKNYYYANLVQFGTSADQFAWVLFSAIPSDMTKNQETYDSVIDSMEYTGEEYTL